MKNSIVESKIFPIYAYNQFFITLFVLLSVIQRGNILLCYVLRACVAITETLSDYTESSKTS